MIKPFHLSIVVSDLKPTREFYVDVLGCEIGRDTGDWIDILFFGHQITIHQKSINQKPIAIDHFGPILEKQEWLKLADQIKNAGIVFEMNPCTRKAGENRESGKFMIKDPDNNILEFKYYNNFSETFNKL